MLNDLGRPAGEGFETNLKGFVLPLYLDALIALRLPRTGERQAAFLVTYLLARQAGEAEEYAASARVFCKLAEAKIAEAYTYVMNSTTEDVALFKAVENEV